MRQQSRLPEILASSICKPVSEGIGWWAGLRWQTARHIKRRVIKPRLDDRRRWAMQLTDKHREYWQKNLRITAILLAIWFVVTFVVGWFARELNAINIIGPLGFYMGAQGALIVYVLIIWYYGKYMNALDQEYGVHEGEDE
jgi:putative solute:sodium symporter small subunit